MTTEALAAPTAADLAGRLETARRALHEAETRLQRARHGAITGGAAGLTEETAAETAHGAARRQVQRLEAALEEQQRLDDGSAHRARLHQLELKDGVFLEHLATVEAAATKLEKILAAYTETVQRYVGAAMQVQRLVPELGARLRTDFSLEKIDLLVGEELARVSAGGVHPPGTNLRAVQFSDPTNLPRLSERVASLTGAWRSDLGDARARRGG